MVFHRLTREDHCCSQLAPFSPFCFALHIVSEPGRPVMQVNPLLPDFFAAFLTDRHALPRRRSHRLVPVPLLIGESVVDRQSQGGEGGDDVESEVETEASVVCRTLV